LRDLGLLPAPASTSAEPQANSGTGMIVMPSRVTGSAVPVGGGRRSKRLAVSPSFSGHSLMLRIDAGPAFGDVKRRPFADELQRPGGRQRPGPPPGDEGVRSVAAGEWVQQRPGWSGKGFTPA
jgi:hypothetical protein